MSHDRDPHREVIPRRFRVGDPEAVSHFNEQGYVVYKSTCAEADTRAIVSKLWDFLEGLEGLGISRADETTWHRYEHCMKSLYELTYARVGVLN